jgi:hypothetical protein
MSDVWTSPHAPLLPFRSSDRSRRKRARGYDPHSEARGGRGRYHHRQPQRTRPLSRLANRVIFDLRMKTLAAWR